jgi:4a-hydroxytetrahydrobiopterin dehydratase
MVQKLSDNEVQSGLAKVPGWSLENGEITRTFELPSFPAALIFVAGVGHLAEAAEHHPDILIKWRKVEFSLTTHDANGISEKDFALAAQINGLYGK